METMRNKGIEIKKVPRFTITSYAIHWSTRSMIVHMTTQKMFQNKVSHVELKKGWGRNQHGLNYRNKQLEPKISAITGDQP